ncbi:MULTISPECIES: hypothetical protein [unclassified Brevibacterium]|uniref:hypothetical protein n=1 Tax=unclassified Brevibacterium TaxID=2614124 RepID=UPI001E341877|nr:MULTISPECIES: hypothetical protein [unclassified Brevibacterium]MCD1285780.1 hypothetical protein [Brevibacterium sp. CCUG 69071]MDK8434841.1 hypothetical protein [Brevibacterium sp. H-BE7]
MTRALISVSQDGFTYLSLNGATSRYSDTGQAMTYLGDYARETATRVSVTIDNGDQGVDVLIDETGQVGAALTPPAGSPTSDSTPTAASASAPPADSTPFANGSAGSASTSSDSAPETDSATTSATKGDGSDASSAAAPDDGAEAANGEEYPLGTPFSGPATPAAPQVKKTRVRKHAPRNRPQQLKKITVPGLVLIGIAILMIGAFVIPNIVPSGSPDSPQTIGSERQVNPASELSVDSTDDVVPSFSNSPKWETKVPRDASVTASDRGVLVVNKGKLQVLDATTGEERYSGEVDEAPTFAVDTIIDGKPALLWQAGDTAEALFDGESEPKRYQLPQKARITSAGTSVLIKSGNKLSTFGADGLVNVPTPEPGSTPMAIENDELFSSDWNGPVKAENIESGDERSIDLEPPADDLQIIDWISAGHGKAITLWGEQGASTNSGHRIQLVVHSLEDGSILSTVTTTTDIVGEMSWVRGQGGQRAYIGPYLFNLENGLLLMDTSSKDINLSEPRGTIVPCTIDNEASCLLAGQHAYRTDTRLLAMTDGGNTVIVDGEDSTIRAYDKKSETQEQ